MVCCPADSCLIAVAKLGNRSSSYTSFTCMILSLQDSSVGAAAVAGVSAAAVTGADGAAGAAGASSAAGLVEAPHPMSISLLSHGVQMEEGIPNNPNHNYSSHKEQYSLL